MPDQQDRFDGTALDLTAASNIMGPAPPRGAARDPQSDVAYGPGGQPLPDPVMLGFPGFPTHVALQLDEDEAGELGHSTGRNKETPAPLA